MTESPFINGTVTTVNLPKRLLSQMDEIIRCSDPGLVSRSSIIRDALRQALPKLTPRHEPKRKFRHHYYCSACQRSFPSVQSFGGHEAWHVKNNTKMT